ncbi:MAG: hypothetical protein HY815_22325 [Candidatus Riflebacteria bacterium]|nr:hypothetical protein [Candidatus Riflebacteria bacterium]
MDQVTIGDFECIRSGLSSLPRADNHAPGDPVEPSLMVMVPGHRSALDPDRALVVANRGMGKSFWAHALADDTARRKAASSFPELGNVVVRIGFNASDRIAGIAPTPAALQEALGRCGDPDTIWRSVLMRVAASEKVTGPDVAALTNRFADLSLWVQSNGERVDEILTRLDDRFLADGVKLVIVFDALDRLANDWGTARRLTTALLKRAVAVRSYRALRLKLFMRRDQFEDPVLFEFPDGSKIRNTRVELKWSNPDLYTLLFTRLEQAQVSAAALKSQRARLTAREPMTADPIVDRSRTLVNAIAGEFMGADKKRGRVYTWLPLHLADAHVETSPRTFLTAWREAALHLPAPVDRAVDHLGLLEGVRKASADRLQELQEDYWWIRKALDPFRGQMVPMERSLVEMLWQRHNTVTSIRQDSQGKGLGPVQIENPTKAPESSLIEALNAIGVIEVRSNGKINVPDIFRVEAGIKRKGGVRPPRRVPPERG